MQDSLLNTVSKLQKEQKEQKINVEDLESILNTEIDEVVSLCKKACLKPKTDSMGNAYFTKSDVDVLKKMKELYKQSQSIQENQGEQIVQNSTIEKAQGEDINLTDPNKKVNFLQKAKTRAKSEALLSMSQGHPLSVLANKMEVMEERLLTKMSDMLSEKMDGFDEIIVELIRAKTENENLRQQVNNLNKQVFILKNEIASYSPLPFGFYMKKDADTL